ncbi:LysE family translocator [Aliiroseovarius sp. Z3]|nr:LysE family translocator [Aliiroseovarius sp. Z3]
MSLEFILTSLVVVLLPGTGVLYTLAVGLSRGFKASIAAAVGCTFGIIPAAVASIIGLAAVLHTSALAFQILKYAGVAYLFFMAWNIVKDGGPMDIEEEKSPRSLVKIAVTGALINVLNPKLSLFFLAFLPQFISPASASSTHELVQLALAFMVMTFIVFVGYGAFSASARTYIISRPSVLRWIKRGFAGTFGFLGLKLATSD